MKDLQKIDDRPLTAQELSFSHLIARGLSLTSAFRKSYPEKCERKADYTIRRYASDLYANANISTEVTTYQQRTAHMARLAEDRIEQILTDDDSMAKGSKVADVAMFMYDHANGKATQKVQHSGVFVSVNYDLSGNNEEVPAEILEQLEDEPTKEK